MGHAELERLHRGGGVTRGRYAHGGGSTRLATDDVEQRPNPEPAVSMGLHG
jgi:hypothetical protein